jgi:hypothetical protein
VVDDPQSSVASGETTVAHTLPPFELEAYSRLHAAVTTTLDPMDELREPDDLGAEALGPDLLGTDDLGAEPLIVESGDVEVIVADGPVLDVGVTGNVATIGWIAPTDADLLLEEEEEEEESDPVLALAFADRPTTDGDVPSRDRARPSALLGRRKAAGPADGRGGLPGAPRSRG